MKRLIYPLLIIILTFFSIKPLFHSGFFPMHDDQQIARLYELDQSIKGGQVPPRWVSGLGFGYGYPLYNFYPPLVYYFAEIAHLLGFSLITSIKIIMGLGFLIASIGMYLLVKELLNKEGGVIAAVLYTYAPYHSVDIYVRGALAEFFSFVAFPFILLALRNLIKSPKIINSILLTISLSVLILTHNLMVLPFAIFLIPYSLFLIFSERKNNHVLKLLVISSSLLATFGLTAYFSLPAVFEKRFTLVDEILIKELANYKMHFLYLRQFWDSPWGYGGSIYGLMDGMSFQVGKIHLILSFIAGIFILRSLILRKNKKEYFFVLILFLFILSLFLASFHSEWLWNLIKPLWYLQFPWRFLAMTAVFSSILGAYGAEKILEIIQNKFLKIIIFITFITIIIVINLPFFNPARYLNVTDKDYTTVEDISWRISKTSFEFVPKGVKTVLSDIGTTQLDIKKDEIAKNSYKVIKGNLNVEEKLNLPHRKEYLMNAKSEGIFRVNTFNFPGWQISIDGKTSLINDNNKLKLITVNIPKGEHKVTAEFTNTPIRTTGNSLSLITIITLIVLTQLTKKHSSKLT